MKTCYNCQRAAFHAAIQASRTEPTEPAFFHCNLHGYTGVDEVDEEGDEFQCPDWQPKQWPDIFTNLAANTSPDHARRVQPEMVKAGVTSCGLALVI